MSRNNIDVDDIPVNPSSNPWLSEVVANRRLLLKGSLGLALGGFLGGTLSGCATSPVNKLDGIAKKRNRLLSVLHLCRSSRPLILIA